MKKIYISPEVEVVSLNTTSSTMVTTSLTVDGNNASVIVSSESYDNEFYTREFTFDMEDSDEGGFDW